MPFIDKRVFDQDIPAVPVKASPRPHQVFAIYDVLAGFSAADRDQLIMACGTGQTLAGLWIDERLGNSSTLVFVPSLSLISQVAKNWHANSADYFDTLYVCSREQPFLGHHRLWAVILHLVSIIRQCSSRN